MPPKQIRYPHQVDRDLREFDRNFAFSSRSRSLVSWRSSTIAIALRLRPSATSSAMRRIRAMSSPL